MIKQFIQQSDLEAFVGEDLDAIMVGVGTFNFNFGKLLIQSAIRFVYQNFEEIICIERQDLRKFSKVTELIGQTVEQAILHEDFASEFRFSQSRSIMFMSDQTGFEAYVVQGGLGAIPVY